MDVELPSSHASFPSFYLSFVIKFSAPKTLESCLFLLLFTSTFRLSRMSSSVALRNASIRRWRGHCRSQVPSVLGPFHTETRLKPSLVHVKLASSMHTGEKKVDRNNTIGFIGLGAMGNHMVIQGSRSHSQTLHKANEISEESSTTSLRSHLS